MTPQQFIAKWQAANLSERSACQQHFLDLCELLGQPKPAAADPEGAWYCFERGVSKTEGGQGWADVWMKGHFGWEYKGKHKDLVAAYRQLLQYRESLDNPPLLVVCDLDRFEVHTNFTGTAKRVYEFDLAGLAQPNNLEVLRRLFTEPDALRPGITSRSVTSLVGEKFGLVADAMRQRSVPPHDVAHFLMKLMFSMFAEDIQLLPNRVFSRTLKQSKNVPSKLSQFLQELFSAMAHGGTFALEEILHFNGGLFADAQVIDLRAEEIQHLAEAADQDWSSVEPHIFGTLFERLLDPAKRSQIGAHYTSSDDIRTLLEPVMMTPLRREWAAVQAKCEALLPTLSQASGVRQLPDGAPSSQIEPYREAYASRSPEPRASRSPRTSRTTKESPARRKLNKLLRDFIERLAHVTVLDPACGSGNFLYVALRLLLDLEKEVITFAAGHKLGLLPQVRPTQLHGIEINPFAQELAQVVIWIGYLQWMRDNGFNPPRDPVLEPIESIQQMDAILDLSDPEHPKEPEWPAAEFIVGNPPFLGDKLMRGGFGDDYVDALRSLYGERIPAQSDLCCYWFEKGRKAIERKRANRCGLLATQGIRGGANRAVLQRIAQTGSIFFAESDREWILDGANVHVSMVGFDDGTESVCILDRANVVRINPNLTATADITAARAIGKNAEIGFIGVSMHGDFDVDEVFGASLLDASGNPTRNANSDVVRPILNAIAITRRDDRRWVVAFPPSLSEVESAHYEQPFEYVKKRVKPIREQNRRSTYRQRWWVHGEARPAMQLALFRLNRYVVTPRVSKHRLFVWVEGVILPSDATVAFARDDDYFFGVLHSHPHELWALKLGTRLETRPRYTPTTCFETFPFPEPTDEQRQAIAAAAAELDQLRTNWLNPPEWTRTEILEFPGSTDGPWARFIDSRPLLPEGALLGEKASPHGKRQAAEADQLAAQVPPGRRNLLGTVRYPRLVPLDEACAKELKKRTLTNLYNQRPAWLDLAHKKLDEAVFAAYGWPPSLTDDELLAKLLALNLERSR